MSNKVEITISSDPRSALAALDQIKASSKGLGDSISALKEHWIGLAAAVATVAAAFKQAYDLALLSARVETLGTVLAVVGKNIGLTAGEMQIFVDKVKQMGITTQEAQTNIIRMAQAHMDLGKSTDLARLAQDAAVIANINSSEAFERLVLGIQRGEIEILKTMGINVNFENSYQKLAASLGKNAQQLTENEKVQARMNVTLETGKTIAGSYEAAMGTAGKQILSMQRYSEELKLKLGDLLNSTLTAIVFDIVQQFKDWDKELQQMKSDGTLSGIADTLSAGVKVALFDIKNLLTDIWNILEPFGPFVKLFGQGIGAAADGWGSILAAMKPVSKMLGDSVAQTTDLGKLLVQTTALILNAAGAMAGISSWKNVTDVYADLKATAGRLSDRGNKFAAGNVGDEVFNALAERETAKGKISTGTSESRMNKAEDERDKALQAAYYGNRTANYGKEAPKPSSAKTADEWKKTSRDLATDLSQINVDEFDKKIADYQNKATDLKEKFKSVKGAAQEIDSWLAGMKGNELSEYEKANNEAILKGTTDSAKERYAVIESSETFITERMKTELEKRLAEEEKAGQTEINKLAGLLAKEYDPVKIEEYETRSNAIREASKKKQLEITEDYNRQILEAETSHQLSMLDAAEKDMTMSKADVTRGRIAVHTTNLAAYNTELQKSIDNKDNLARQGWQTKIDQENASLREQNQILQEQTDTFTGGLIEAVREYAYNMQTAFQSGKQAVTDMASSMESTFKSAFENMRKGTFDLKDTLIAFCDSVSASFEAMLSKMLTNYIMTGNAMKSADSSSDMSSLGGIGGWIAKFFGGEGNMSIDFDTAGGIGGGGSVIPSAKGNAFSAAGLKPYLNTVVSKPTIFKFAHGGIGVMGEAGKEAIMPLTRTASGNLGVRSEGSATPAVTVNVINQTTKDVTAQQQGDVRFDGKKWVLDVIMKEWQSNPSVRQQFSTGKA